jgi:predicted phosphoadenosine phosphosulfate sulfurtransferase
MYLRGKSIHDMRICQPYGDDQRKGLDLFQECEPETRDRVLKRVSGVNYGAIYRGQRVLGNYKVNLPKGHTYKSYSIYLLSTLPKPIRIHYLRRIAVFINWHRMKEGYTIIPDFANEKEEASKKKPSRRRICKAILKNDYYCKSLSFTMNTFEFETLIEIEKKCIIKEKIEEKDN